MKKENSLQKFTESEIKINEILLLKEITHSDLEHLSKAEGETFNEIITKRFNELKGIERDRFYNKIEPITSQSTKNQLWEMNHNNITWAISTLIQESGRMPSKTEIATKTELSRQTIHKHFNEYKTHPQYLGQIEQFSFLSSKVLAKVFQFAINGDIGAAKLYFNVMGFMKEQVQNNTLIQNQNNYIQINGTVLNQDVIKNLNAEQLNSIETILKTALPQPSLIS